jgi:hypothetical protein
MQLASVPSKASPKEDDDSSVESASTRVSPLPKIWIGFVLAALFILYQLFLDFLPAIFRTRYGFPGGASVICLSAMAYWLFCVYRFHRILEETTHGQYPVEAKRAAVLHLVPVYNLYWMFKWPSELVKYMNHKGRVQMTSGWVIGLLILFSVIILSKIDGSLSIAALFFIAMYIKKKLSIHLEVLERVMPH